MRYAAFLLSVALVPAFAQNNQSLVISAVHRPLSLRRRLERF